MSVNFELHKFSLHKLLKCVLLWVFVGFSANAQVVRIDTIDCTLEASDTSYINKMVRHEGEIYNQIFNTRKNDSAMVNFSIYGKNKAYIKEAKANKFKVVANGLYSEELNRNFVYKNDRFLHVVLYTASTNLLRSNYPDAPRWLIEGFANVMSMIDETGDRQIKYVPIFDYNARIKQLMWKEEGIDFEELFTMSDKDWDRGANSAKLNMLSYGIVYFLITRDRDKVTPIISAMKGRQSAADAFTMAYGSVEEFKKLFLFYYRFSAKSKFSMAD